MNIPKAIKLLSIELGSWPHKGSDDWYVAVGLGIEALKRLKEEKDKIPDSLWNPLSGETKD